MPLIGNGSEKDHLNIILSSKKLLYNKNHFGVFHLDGTYKITVNGFPLIVFGVSDLIGQFHPVSFMISSHETEKDFDYFFTSIINQC